MERQQEKKKTEGVKEGGIVTIKIAVTTRGRINPQRKINSGMYLQQSAGTVSSSYFIMFTGLIKDMHHCAFKSYQFQFTFIFIAGFLFSKALWRLKKQPYVIKNKTWPAVPIRASQKNAITGIQIYKMKFTLITLLNCPSLVLLSESKTSWLTSKRI